MIIDFGHAAANYVLVYKDGLALGHIVSINTGTRSASRFKEAPAYSTDTEVISYDEVICTEEAPDFVRLIPGMRTVKDLVCMTTICVMPQFPVTMVSLDIEDQLVALEETPSRPTMTEYERTKKWLESGPKPAAGALAALGVPESFGGEPVDAKVLAAKDSAMLKFHQEPGRMTFVDRLRGDYASSQDPNERLVRCMWELLDAADPVVLECFRRNRIEFLDQGVKVFPID